MTNKLILNIFFFIQALCIIACVELKDNKSKLISPNKELKILLNDPVETLDPLQILYDSDWRVSNNIFEGLFSLNEQHKLINCLVESYSISNNNLDYTFRIRDNIYFHNNPCFSDFRGRKLDSYDVKYTFERLATKKNHFSNWEIINNKIVGISEFYKGESDNISGIVIIDSLTLQFKLTNPFSSFLNILTSPGFYIVPREGVEYFKEDFKYNPVGTGPFRISEFILFEKITLVKNKNYYKLDEDGFSLPYIQSITYSIIDESENRFTELVKNNTNFISASQLEYNKFVKDSVLLSGFSTKTISGGDGIRFWGFNFNKSNNDAYKELRKGIALGLNRQYLNNNHPIIKAETLIPSFYLNENIKWYKHDKDYKCDSELIKKEIDTVKIMANMVYNDLLEIEKVLDKLKLPYKRIIKRAGYYSQISKINPTLFRVSMVPAFPDPIEYYSLFYSKNSGGINLGNYSNKQFDDIYEYVLGKTNDELKNEAYKKLEEILKAEIAAIYLTHQGPVNYIFSNNLKNINFNYILPNFTQAYFE